ncbi:MAG: hypothetical protein Q4A70_03450 [Candidatus Saccharibacteria bacterium]|nr:hypothetical protein [Candidatus Saccharibacteria bacterium]
MKKRFLNKTYLVPGGMVLVTMLVGGLLALPGVMADDSAVSTATITVPVSCTMSGTGMNSHTASIENGRKVEGIGTTDIKAFCNDSEGFSIYAVGFTGDTIGNTYLRDTNLGQTDDILTSTTLSGNTSAWAMKLGATTGTYTPIIAGSTADSEKQAGDTDYSDWAAVPASYQRVAYRNSATDLDNGSTAEGAQLTTTYAVYISPTQKAGTYVGKVKYTLVHPATGDPNMQPQVAEPGCINYYPNGSNVIGTMGCQSATDNASVDLLASNFSRTGYGFAGWSDAYDYATNLSAHFYGPQETITAPVGTTANGLSLYAVWIKSQGSIQDTSKVASVCSSLITAPTDGTANLKSVSALTDQRDNNTYAIAKLADGKCWMIENLRLEAEDTRSDANKALAQGYGTSATYGNFSGLADAESTNFGDITTANSLYYSGTQEGTASIDICTSDYPGYRMPRYNNWNNQSTSANRPQNPTSNSATNSTTNAGMYSYGNYYTWHAAIADLTYNDTNDQSTTGTSLCPTGWHLPTGGLAYASGNTGGVNVTGDPSTFREFYNLGYTIMGSNTTAYEDTPSSGQSAYSGNTTNANGDTATKAFRKYPNNFIYSGYFYNSSARYRGSMGKYWSSTANNSLTSRYLNLYSSNVRPGTVYSDKNTGFSIRCTVSAGT